MIQTVDSRIEQQNLWWVFHKHFIIEMFEQLRDQLGDAYLVDLESQVLLIPNPPSITRTVSPDVEVSTLYSPGTLATTTIKPTPALLEADETLSEIEQYAIHIRRRDLLNPLDPLGSQVVSVIELVSPSNKGLSGRNDRRKFLTKRQDYLASSVSYTEIDLLLKGDRNLPKVMEPLENYPYLTWASQIQPQTRHHWGWGWDVTDTLPVITLPLDHPYIHLLDLGHCYQQAYQRNRWEVRLPA